MEATYRRKGQRGRRARALIRREIADACAALEGLVGELVEFHIECPPAPSCERPIRPPRPLKPLASALSAEAHLLASLPPHARPPDMLGMAGVLKLMALATERAGTEQAAVA